MVPAPAPTRSLAADRALSRCSTERKAWTPPRAGCPTTAFRLPRAAHATPASRRCSCRPSTRAASISGSSVPLEPNCGSLGTGGCGIPTRETGLIEHADLIKVSCEMLQPEFLIGHLGIGHVPERAHLGLGAGGSRLKAGKAREVQAGIL